MKKTFVLALLPLTFTFNSCSESKNDTESFEWKGGKVWLDRISHDQNCIRFTRNGEDVSVQPLPWPVYRFTFGDLNGDSIPEIAVGVIKKTPYWQQVDRRLFIYGLYKGRDFYPVWRGSHVASKLIDFTIDSSTQPAKVHTLEQRADSSHYEAEYVLGAFGLRFIKYLKENSSPKQYYSRK